MKESKFEFENKQDKKEFKEIPRGEQEIAMEIFGREELERNNLEAEEKKLEAEVAKLLNAYGDNERHLYLYHPKGEGETEVVIGTVSITGGGDGYHVGHEVYLIHRNQAGHFSKKLLLSGGVHDYLYVQEVTRKDNKIKINIDVADEVPYYYIKSRKVITETVSS